MARKKAAIGTIPILTAFHSILHPILIYYGSARLYVSKAQSLIYSIALNQHGNLVNL